MDQDIRPHLALPSEAGWSKSLEALTFSYEGGYDYYCEDRTDCTSS